MVLTETVVQSGLHRLSVETPQLDGRDTQGFGSTHPSPELSTFPGPGHLFRL